MAPVRLMLPGVEGGAVKAAEPVPPQQWGVWVRVPGKALLAAYVLSNKSTIIIGFLSVGLDSVQLQP